MYFHCYRLSFFSVSASFELDTKIEVDTEIEKSGEVINAEINVAVNYFSA